MKLRIAEVGPIDVLSLSSVNHKIADKSEVIINFQAPKKLFEDD